MPTVTCFGEVLWDVFPTHKTVGGAPLNVALRLKSFGVDAQIISRIGKDENGRELTKYVLDNKLDISTIQVDNTYKTGAVNVMLDDKGSASYEIEYPVAWDKIKANEESIRLVEESDAFIFGSLACRNDVSRETLFQLLKDATFKVFDVNLRPPHYSMSMLLELMEKADLIKCNDEEIFEITKELSFDSKSLEECIRFLSKRTVTDKICVTKGSEGALLFYDNQFFKNKGYTVRVADTVGAGDSFLAALVFKLLSNFSPQESLDFATVIGALVASNSGANPIISINSILQLLEK